MKKTLFFTLLFTVVNMVYAQNKPYITRGHVINADSVVIAHFYIAGDTSQMYWGCHDTIIPYTPHNDVYQLVSDKNDTVTAIPLQTKKQQNNVTIAFGKLLQERKLSVKDSFSFIFDFYRTYKSAYADWTSILLFQF